MSIVLGIVAAVLLAVLAFVFLIRPWSHARGATREELRAAMPGDDLVPNPKTGYTQAITIHAPPESVWPWLVQVGYRRAGLYTYDCFYRLI